MKQLMRTSSSSNGTENSTTQQQTGAAALGIFEGPLSTSIPKPPGNSITATTFQAAKQTLDNIDANGKFLRSKDNNPTPKQEAFFHSFSVSLAASYNKNLARIQGLEQHLAPYIPLDWIQ